MKMRRCEDEKVFYRPPLLEEPCAQTLSGKIHRECRHVPTGNHDCLLYIYIYIYKYVYYMSIFWDLTGESD